MEEVLELIIALGGNYQIELDLVCSCRTGITLYKYGSSVPGGSSSPFSGGSISPVWLPMKRLAEMKAEPLSA